MNLIKFIDNNRIKRSGMIRVIYWIKYPEMTDPYKQGYIGQTFKDQVLGRFVSHTERDSVGFISRNNLELKRLEFEILHEGDNVEIDNLENKYRPLTYIGWNAAIGGTNLGITRIKYNINGVIYEDINDAVKVLGLTTSAIKGKCYSTSEKHKNWLIMR